MFFFFGPVVFGSTVAGCGLRAVQGAGGGGGHRPVAGGADGPRPVGEEALALAKLVCVSCWRRVVGVLPHLMAAGWCALARGRWAGPAGGRCGLARRTPPPPPHQAVTGAFCCGRIHGAARVPGRLIRRLGAELWGPAGPVAAVSVLVFLLWTAWAHLRRCCGCLFRVLLVWEGRFCAWYYAGRPGFGGHVRRVVRTVQAGGAIVRCLPAVPCVSSIEWLSCVCACRV